MSISAWVRVDATSTRNPVVAKYGFNSSDPDEYDFGFFDNDRLYGYVK